MGVHFFAADQDLLITTGSMLVSVRFGNITDQPVFITAAVVLVGFDAAVSLGFHCDRRKYQGICCNKNDNGRSDADSARKQLPRPAVFQDFPNFGKKFSHVAPTPCCYCYFV